MIATGPQQDRHACQGTASGLDWHTRRARTGKPGVRCEAGVSPAVSSKGERKNFKEVRGEAAFSNIENARGKLE